MKNAELLPHDSGIYKIENLINGKIYIGQSKDIYMRYHNHHKYEYKNESRANFHLYQAFKKYGLENFSIEAIELCPPEQLNDREIYWIKYYNSFKKGYNMTEGGSSLSPNIHSQETEQKRAITRAKTQSLQGENHPRAKLTNEEVLSIRQRYINGESAEQIYKDYCNIYSNFGTFQQIILGKHYAHVGNIPNKIDKKMANSKFTVEDILEIRRLYYTKNFTQHQLANKYNVAQTTIADIVNHRSYKEIIDDIPDLRNNKKIKFTDQQVRDIRQKAEQGLSIQQIAAEYGKNIAIIRKCINRQTYKNIE